VSPVFAHHDFLNPSFSTRNLDRFFSRRAILEALLDTLPSFTGIVLDVGCGNIPYKSLVLAPPSRATHYLGIDLKYLGQELKENLYSRPPDLYWDGTNIPLADKAIDTAMATEVFEHCSNLETVLNEIYRVLKPGGHLFFTVPFLWPLHDVPYDEYRYTPFALKRLLRNAGFNNIQMGPTGGWDAALAQMMGLWVRRRPMSRMSRRTLRPLLSFCFWPLIWLLYKIDTPSAEFTESSMMTGISGTAWKK
jgi:SAM-dependent methyltransferase